MNPSERHANNNKLEQISTELPLIVELQYPEHDLATASRVLNILSNPLVSNAYNTCIEYSYVEDAYISCFNALQRACEKARDEVPEHMHTLAPVGMIFCYASIHQTTGRFHQCESELNRLIPTFAPFDVRERALKKYTKSVLNNLK